jgi:hypothetical protein
MIAQKRRIFGMPGGIACELCILQMRGGRLRRAKAACCGRLRDASAGSGRSRCAFAVRPPFVWPRHYAASAFANPGFRVKPAELAYIAFDKNILL